MVLVFWVCIARRPDGRPFPLTPGSSPGQFLTLSHGGERGYPCPALPDCFVSDQEWVT